MTLKLDINKKIGSFQLNVQGNIESNRIGILGASGCGKSMTLKCIAGIESNDFGCISIDNRVLMDSDKKINLKPKNRKLGYLFQNYALFPTMTVEKNIAAGLTGKSKEEVKETVAQMITRFRLNGLEKLLPGQLSGGQQQRVALARIMAYEPQLIMLDEPFSALDSHLKEHLLLEIQDMLKDYQGTVLLVSHNRDEIYQLTDWLIVMENGHVVSQGATKELFKNPEYMTVARLTGCKNISRCTKLSEYKVFASDWDLELETSEAVSEDIKYVGIRAHELRKAESNDKNSFAFRVQSAISAPFELVYMLKKQDSNAQSNIWWKTAKHNITDSIDVVLPDYLCLPKDKLLLLK